MSGFHSSPSPSRLSLRPPTWRLALAGLLTATLVSTAFASERNSPSPAADEAAIRALLEETQAANNAGDVERWVALFADDAVYMPPGVPAITDRQGLVEIAEAGFRHQAAIDIEPLEVVVSGDWAFARTRVRGTVTVEGTGEVVPIDTKQLLVYQRTGAGEWRIARMISNSNQS